MNFKNRLSILVLLTTLVSAVFVACSDDDDPVKEDTPEMITKVTLTFTPAGEGDPVVVTAADPDGEGVQDLQIDGPIELAANTMYLLNITLTNELVDPSDDGYDITAEVEEEGDEHMFFFSWTNGLFNDPSGNGNIDNAQDDVNYNDLDDNGLPIGLRTLWTTGDAGSGSFRVVLKHQPDLKSNTSGVSVGETDLDLEFDLVVE